MVNGLNMLIINLIIPNFVPVFFIICKRKLRKYQLFILRYRFDVWMQAENGRILLWNLLNNFIDVIAFDIGEFD